MFRKLVVCSGVESRRGASSHGAVYPKVVTWHVKHTEAYWVKVVITLGELVALLILCNSKTWTSSDQNLCSTDNVHLTPSKAEWLLHVPLVFNTKLFFILPTQRIFASYRPLNQCFSTFVRPRPGEFFFYKTRARFQQIYSSVPFQFFLSSYIKLT